MIDNFDSILPQSEANFNNYTAKAHIETIEARAARLAGDGEDLDNYDEAEFDQTKNPILKMEEDEEML
ncbi:hypothetical protein PtB15_18B4 [Puccinia triticina]|nr:hypothetical protein PtB15_18B4 [Puccinia triticina]